MFYLSSLNIKTQAVMHFYVTAIQFLVYLNEVIPQPEALPGATGRPRHGFYLDEDTEKLGLQIWVKSKEGSTVPLTFTINPDDAFSGENWIEKEVHYLKMEIIKHGYEI